MEEAGGGLSEPAFLADLPLARAAHAFAAERHAGQTRRPDGAPFIRHPEEVAALLHDAGLSEPVVAAGLLHDVLEKTDTTVEELERRFGPEVVRLVEAVSEDDRIDSYADRKAALIDSAVGAGPDGAALLAADKISKVRDFRARLQQAAAGDDSRELHKLEHYRQSLAALERSLPGHPLTKRLRAELADVEVATPGSAPPRAPATAPPGSR